MAESDIWEKKENLEHAKELVNEFERKLGMEVRRQEGVEQRWRIKLNPRADEFKRIELLEKFIAKLLYRWDDKKFEEEYLKKLERNWNKWKNDRKECEKKYTKKIDEKEYEKKLEESLERNEIDKKIRRIIWGD